MTRRPALSRISHALALMALTAPALAVTSAGGQTLDYAVEVAPVEDSGLRQALVASSNLFSLQDQPPDGARGLLRRVDSDLERLQTVLRSFGYYGGTVDITIDGVAATDPNAVAALENRPADAEAEVVIMVSTGPLFTIGIVDLVDIRTGSALLADTLPSGAADPLALGLEPGSPAQAEAVLNAEDQLVGLLRRGGYPFAAVPVRQAWVDFPEQRMQVALAVDAGPQAVMGPVTFTGLDRVDEAYVRRQVPFATGAPYDPDLLATLRRNLVELGLFTAVRLDLPTALDDQGRYPVTVVLTERPRRTIGGEASFSTSEGLDLAAFWRHRNLFGAGESVQIEATLGNLLIETAPDAFDYRLAAEFGVPDFLRGDQTLTLGTLIERESSDAFVRSGIDASIGVERALTPTVTANLGTGLSISEIEDQESTERFALLSLPVGLRFDNTDDLLDPTRGLRIDTTVTPYLEATGIGEPFIRTETAASTYFDLSDAGRLVAALRTRFGAIAGREADALPANLRFFSGGGGSVRAFGFQRIGPLDDGDDPLGGISVVEVSAELRYRVTDSIGIVPFIEAGNVFDTVLPSFENSLLYGGGLGARYYTGIGPIRVDFAFPINGRDDDDLFQFYVSIGQAF